MTLLWWTRRPAGDEPLRTYAPASSPRRRDADIVAGAASPDYLIPVAPSSSPSPIQNWFGAGSRRFMNHDAHHSTSSPLDLSLAGSPPRLRRSSPSSSTTAPSSLAATPPLQRR